MEHEGNKNNNSKN